MIDLGLIWTGLVTTAARTVGAGSGSVPVSEYAIQLNRRHVLENLPIE